MNTGVPSRPALARRPCLRNLTGHREGTPSGRLNPRFRIHRFQAFLRAATQLAQQVCALGPRIAVIKLGSLGALAIADGTIYTHPIVPIEPVDPVGAGDAFVGAFLAELAAKNPIETCLASVAKMGALVCAVPRGLGGHTGLEHRSHPRPESDVRR